MGPGGSTKQMQVLFSGRVQGVGFRYTVSQLAMPLNLTGYVKNRPDGDVELVAEGSERVLIGFFNDIRKSHLNSHIVREQIRWKAATNEFDKFRILG